MEKKLFIFRVKNRIHLVSFWLIALLFSFTNISAQVITVGTGTNTHDFAPFWRQNNYSVSEMMYYGSEIGTTGYITHLAFFKGTGASTAIPNVRVYMKRSAATVLVTPASTAGYTLVYTGTWPNGADNSWHTQLLNTSFSFPDITENLSILIIREENAISANSNFAYSVTPNTRCSYYGSATNNWASGTTGMTLTTNRPNAQFTISPCPNITFTPAAASLPDATINVSYSQQFTAAAVTGATTYAITNGAVPAGLTLDADGLLSGVPTLTGTFTFTVTATDANACSGSKEYTMTVNCQTITVGPTALPNPVTDQSYSTTIFASNIVGTPVYSVTSGALPPGLSLNANGTLSGVATTPGVYTFTVTASDANGCRGARNYTVNVDCNPIVITPATLSNGRVGSSYNATLSQSGGSNVVYAVTSGLLPAGLTLSAAGVISGTPTHPGTANFEITATNINGCTQAQAFSITIDCQLIDFAPYTLPNLSTGVRYSQTFVQSGAIGTPVFEVTSGTIVPGLTLSADGILSGTPTAAGSFTFWITVSDNIGCSFTREYTVNVDCHVYLEPFQPVCKGSAPIHLSGGYPHGGFYSGPDVLNDDFVPLEVGFYPITYTYNNGDCSGTLTQVLEVIECGLNVNDISKQLDWNCYPNPASHRFTVGFEQAARSDVLITILSIDGKVMQQVQQKNVTGNFSKTLDVQQYAKGIYLVELTTNAGKFTKRISIQ